MARERTFDEDPRFGSGGAEAAHAGIHAAGEPHREPLGEADVATALAARQVVADALRDGGDQLRSMGAGALAIAVLMLMHERWAMATVMLIAFGRAIAEVGAVMIVGGNIDGVTRVMTTAIALETSKGDLPLALALGIVLLSVVALINAVIALISHGRGVPDVEWR